MNVLASKDIIAFLHTGPKRVLIDTRDVSVASSLGEGIIAARVLNDDIILDDGKQTRSSLADEGRYIPVVQPVSAIDAVVLIDADRDAIEERSWSKYRAEPIEHVFNPLLDWIFGYLANSERQGPFVLQPLIVTLPAKLVTAGWVANLVLRRERERYLQLSAAYCDSLRELIAIRDEAEQLQRTNSDLSNYLYSMKVDGPALALVLDPDEKENPDLGKASKTVVIEQWLGASTRGFLACELFFQEAEAPVGGRAKIELIQSETDECLARWQISPQTVTPGWNSFTVLRAVSGHRFSAVLRLEGPASTLALVRFARHSIFAKPALINGATCARALAMRLSTGLPGVQYQAEIKTADEERTHFEALADAERLLSNIRLVEPPFPEPRFPLLQRIDSRTFQIHPLIIGMVGTVVSVADLAISEFLAASISVRSPNSEAPPMEVTMMVVEADAAAAPITAKEMYTLLEKQEWTPLLPGQGTSLEREGPFSAGAAIVFAARLTNPASGQDGARTHWGRLTFLVESGKRSSFHVADRLAQRG